MRGSVKTPPGLSPNVRSRCSYVPLTVFAMVTPSSRSSAAVTSRHELADDVWPVRDQQVGVVGRVLREVVSAVPLRGDRGKVLLVGRHNRVDEGLLRRIRFVDAQRPPRDDVSWHPDIQHQLPVDEVVVVGQRQRTSVIAELW